MSRKGLARLTAIVVTGAALQTDAAPLTTTWLGGSGSWTDSGQWTNGAPSNTPTDSYTALVDDGQPATSVATLDSTVSIDTLTVSSGDEVVVTPSGRLHIEGTAVQNGGVITLQGPSTDSITATGPVVLSGGGVIRLDGGELSVATLTNQDNVIEGWGAVGVFDPDGELVNNAVIDANVPNKLLLLKGVDGINNGTLRASNGGHLAIELAPGTGMHTQAGGVIEAVDGSFVEMIDFTQSTDATIRALNQSTIHIAGVHSGSLFTADPTSHIQHSGGDLVLFDATFEGSADLGFFFAGGTLTNHGNVNAGSVVLNNGPLTLENSGDFSTFEIYDAPLTLTGGGTFHLLGPVTPISRLSIITNIDNTIQGEGPIRVASNGGTVEATTGTMSVRGSPVTHTGTFGARTGGTLEVLASITGTGDWRADGGLIDVTDTGNVQSTGDVIVAHGGSLRVDTFMSAGSVVVDETGSLDIRGVLAVAGDVDYQGPASGRVQFFDGSSMHMTRESGGPVGSFGDWQFLETGGANLGSVPEGFTVANVYLPELRIAPSGRLVLRDARDNGNRVFGAEALYVGRLVFEDASGLLDLNGIDLYFNELVGAPSQIIDVAVPEPGVLWLLGLAFLGLIARASVLQ